MGPIPGLDQGEGSRFAVVISDRLAGTRARARHAEQSALNTGARAEGDRPVTPVVHLDESAVGARRLVVVPAHSDAEGRAHARDAEELIRIAPGAGARTDRPVVAVPELYQSPGFP